MSEVPQSFEERAAVLSGFLRQAKAAGAAGQRIAAERAQLEHYNFCVRCELQDARLNQDTAPDKLAHLEEAVRVSNAGLEKLAAEAAAAGEC